MDSVPVIVAQSTQSKKQQTRDLEKKEGPTSPPKPIQRKNINRSLDIQYLFLKVETKLGIEIGNSKMGWNVNKWLI